MVQNSPSESFILSSESVTEGHPDKVCDYISDSILDAYLAQDNRCRVACEALCKGGTVVLAGEITSKVGTDHEAIVRQAIRDCGYDDNSEAFSADNVKIIPLITKQAQEIATAVGNTSAESQGTGDAER